MTITDKFMDDSARAAIRALRGLEQTAIMLETYGPDIFPEVNEHGQKHFGRVMMEGAAASIRQAWADAIKEAENSKRADQVALQQRLAAALHTAIKIADEAREEWDKAPSDMRAGKLLIALSGHLPGYRADIDEIFAALAAVEIPDAKQAEPSHA